MKTLDLNKILFAFSVLVLVLVGVWGYVYVFVQHNFLIKTSLNCDPLVENCFTDEEDYYKYVILPADEYQICLANNTCDSVCTSGTCEVIYCTEEEVEDWESCVGPGSF